MMNTAFSQVDLRCDRCRHPWRHHGLQGCLVAKVEWDNEAQAYKRVDTCACKWYIGELPPLEASTDCPHEIQDQAEKKSDRLVCVHCGKKTKKS